MIGSWLSSLVEVGNAVRAKGGEISFMNADQPGVVRPAQGLTKLFKRDPVFNGGEPLTDAQLASLVEQFGGPLPAELRQLFEQLGSRGGYWWDARDRVSLPADLRAANQGGFEWYFDEGSVADDSRAEWARAFEDLDDEALKEFWDEAFGVLCVPNGDVWVIDKSAQGRGRVIYLDHEGGDDHGCLLGPDIVTVMNNWTRIGCVGPEFWNLEPFLDREKGIDGFGKAALEFRKALGLPA